MQRIASISCLQAIRNRGPTLRVVVRGLNRIDLILADDPEHAVEEFYGDRILVELPLAVTFTVSPEDRWVEVLQVWHR